MSKAEKAVGVAPARQENPAKGAQTRPPRQKGPRVMLPGWPFKLALLKEIVLIALMVFLIARGVYEWIQPQGELALLRTEQSEMAALLKEQQNTLNEVLAKVSKPSQVVKPAEQKSPLPIKPAETISQPRERKIQPQQVLIAVIAGTSKLNYEEDCKDALIRFFRAHAKPSPHKVGLVLVVGEKASSMVRMGEDLSRTFDETAFDQRLPSTYAESPGEHLAAELKDAFPMGATGPRRVIFIASTDCPCPDQRPEWKQNKSKWPGLDIQVDALLLAPRDAKAKWATPALGSEAVTWPSFCARMKDGACHILHRPVKAEALTTLLFDRLQRIAAPVEQLP